MDELKAMRTFAQVVANGSFAGASRALDVAPAVVTRQIADLERHLGARLLARSQVIACAAPEYLERHGRPRHPDELAEHQLLLPPLQKGWTFVRAGDEAGTHGERITVAPARPLMHSTSPDLHQAGALAGIGIAGVASFAADDALRARSLD